MTSDYSEKIEYTIECLESVDSTNSELKRRINASKAIELTAITAKTQTMGRGRRGREWLNTDGALLMSIGVPIPDMDGADYPLITVAAAVGVCEALRGVGADCGIKWPNDIMINAHKVCGILTEITRNAALLPVAIIGIGVNVNSDRLPSDLMQPAISIKTAIGRSTDINALSEQIILNVVGHMDDMRKQSSRMILDRYRKLGIIIGKAVTVYTGDGIAYDVIAKDIDNVGKLIVEHANGVLQTIDSADVSIRI